MARRQCLPLGGSSTSWLKLEILISGQDLFSMNAPVRRQTEAVEGSMYRADIDGLRAIAVIFVLLFHGFPTLLTGGFVGVDIFFVISGFLISRIILQDLRDDKFTFNDFYSRRMRRICPALILVLLVTFLIGWWILLPGELKMLGREIFSGSLFIYNLIFACQTDYFANSPESSPLLHLWSLGVEEQFYIVWPLLLWGTRKLGWKPHTAIWLVGLASFGLNLLQSGHIPNASFFLPQTRFWELLMGAAVAASPGLSSRPAVSTGTRDLLSASGGFLIAGAAIFLTHDNVFPGAWALLPTLGAVLLILAGPAAWLNRVVLSRPAMVSVGRISYPLYLWHWPLLTFAAISSSEPLSAPVRLGVLALSIALATGTYLWIEKPVRRIWRWSLFIWLVPMLLFASLGFTALYQEGFPDRFAPDVRDLVVTPETGQELRTGTCFLTRNQTAVTFANCETPAWAAQKPSLLLWGDSHAAHLFSGLQSSFGARFNIIQRTAQSCPPMLKMTADDRFPNCRATNEFILSWIAREKPGTVILAGIWTAYDWTALEDTILRLKAAGVGKIILVGPVPQWRGSLPRQVYMALAAGGADAHSDHMRRGLLNAPGDVDREMAEWARRHGVDYVSAIGILCNETGCLTRISSSGGGLTSFDYGHLTTSGSRYLVAHFPTSFVSSNE
jgi:peptidoglycan/LPS O-acetylase OafA/YrhL